VTESVLLFKVCGSRWTEWLDRDDPGGDGDEESLSQLRHEFPHMVCANPVAVEARMTDGRYLRMKRSQIVFLFKKLLHSNEKLRETAYCGSISALTWDECNENVNKTL